MRYLIFCLIFVTIGCSNSKDSKNGSDFLVVIDQPASLRAGPGVKSREIKALTPGEGLRDLGEISRFLTALQFGDSLYQAPWIKVENADHQSGWVFARAVRPVRGNPAEWYLQKNMLCYWGKSLTDRRNRLIETGTQLKDAEGFIRYYRESATLRDTMMQLLAQRAEPNEADFKPDFAWLPQVLPGFVFQWIVEGTQPFLFTDYRYWNRLAASTANDPRDDQFMQLCLRAFPVDSIESFFPGWTIQTEDYSGSSQLGLGIHLKMLQYIGQCAQQPGKIFEPELERFKEAVLNDILDKNTTYWQPKEKIIQEIRQIFALSPQILSDRDKLALRERLPMFENAPANGVRVNLRTGL
ncbi:MAG: SH3 domain-containing protein [Bacteroidota bacterium]